MDYASKLYTFCLLHYDTTNLPALVEYLQPRQGEKILEIGCNRGRLLKKIVDLGTKAFGIDVNPYAIENRTAGVETALMDATQLTFPGASFDKIYSLHVIEHIPNLKKAFEEMARVLRPGGRIVLFYPAEPIRGLFAIPSALVMWKNPLDIHVNKLNPRKIAAMASSLGLEHVESHFPVRFTHQYVTVLQKKS